MLDELRGRLAFVLPEALEVFGHARLVWASAPWGVPSPEEKEWPTAREWYDLCRCQLAHMAVGGEALDAIFSTYVFDLEMKKTQNEGKTDTCDRHRTR